MKFDLTRILLICAAILLAIFVTILVGIQSYIGNQCGCHTEEPQEPIEPAPIVSATAVEPIETPEALPPIETTKPKRYELTDEERALVEAVVAAEAMGEDFNGQVMVAQCILNTAEATNQRPDDVVLTKGQYADPKPEYRDMVRDAVAAVFDDGYEATPEPIRYFYAPKYCTSKWHEEKLVFVVERGGHRFFKTP